MAAVPYSNTPCLDLALAIDTAQAQSAYQLGQYDLQDFIKSEENRNSGLVKAVQIDRLIDTGGKYLSPSEKGKFKVYAKKQICTPQTFTESPECSALVAGTTEPEPVGEDFYASEKIGFTFTVNHEEYKDKCYTADMAKERFLGEYKDQALSQIENFIISEIAKKIGKYNSQLGGVPNSGDTPVSANILNDYGTMNAQIFTALKLAFRRKKIQNKIKFFGDVSGVIASVVEGFAFASANQNGTDITKLNGVNNFGLSERLNEALDLAFPTATGDHILGVPYGSYQLIEYFNYDSEGSRVKYGTRGFFEKTTIDAFGWKWDVHMERNKCIDIFEFKKQIGLYSQPVIACADNLALNFLGGCGTADCTSMSALRNC